MFSFTVSLLRCIKKPQIDVLKRSANTCHTPFAIDLVPFASSSVFRSHIPAQLLHSCALFHYYTNTLSNERRPQVLASNHSFRVILGLFLVYKTCDWQLDGAIKGVRKTTVTPSDHHGADDKLTEHTIVADHGHASGRSAER